MKRNFYTFLCIPPNNFTKRVFLADSPEDLKNIIAAKYPGAYIINFQEI